MTSSFVIERSILAIQYALYKKGGKGMDGAFNLPMQVTMVISNCYDRNMIMKFSEITSHKKMIPSVKLDSTIDMVDKKSRNVY